MTLAVATSTVSPDYRAARDVLAHRFRPTGVIDVEGEGRVSFLQGQLTQDVQTLREGETRPAAGLTPKGKLIFMARVIRLSDRLRTLIPIADRSRVVEHFRKYVIFQKVDLVDRSEEFVRIGLYGPRANDLGDLALEELFLPGEGEFSAEILAPASQRGDLERRLRETGSIPVSEETAEVLRVEAGRPRFGQDADPSNTPDEVGMDSAISTTKGCYVGQEIVARMRTYGRVNKRLVGFRFPEGAIPAGALLKMPEELAPGKVEAGRVTSSVISPSFGAIGLGYAFRDVPAGGRLLWTTDASLGAVVTALPFA